VVTSRPLKTDRPGCLAEAPEAPLSTVVDGSWSRVADMESTVLARLTVNPVMSLGMSVLCEYAIAACYAYCRIFRIRQQSAHITFFSG